MDRCTTTLRKIICVKKKKEGKSTIQDFFNQMDHIQH